MNPPADGIPRLRRAAFEYLSGIVPPNPADREMCRSMTNALAHRDVKSFLLPANGAIIEPDTECRLTLESCRLPFPTCALEYEYKPGYWNLKSNRWAPIATILLVNQPEAGGPIRLHAYWRIKDGKFEWVQSFLGIQIEPTSVLNILPSIENAPDVRLDGMSVVGPERLIDKVSRQDVLNDYMDEARVLAHFALLSSCSNVKSVPIYAASKERKKRAARNGALPPDDYWVLDCMLGEPSVRGEDQGGTHASPRFHVRRGHVRRLDDQRLTWIRQTTVGSYGHIEKDYRLVQSKGDAAP